MVRILATVDVRQRLWLLLGIAAAALSLLAMLQLSSNHTAAGTRASSTAAATDATHPMSVVHADSSEQQDTIGPTHLAAVIGHGHPNSEVGGCPGCADHSAMGLTCLAALILLLSGSMLARPLAGRGLWLRRSRPLMLVERRCWLPRSRTLAQLSVSRT